MSGRLKILMVCPQFRPLVGGYERAAERLSAALHARGHGVVVVAERRDPTWAREEDLAGVTLRRLWCVMRPGIHQISAVLSLFAFLLRHGRSFDVIHVHQYGAPLAVCVLASFILRRPVVLKLSSTGPQGIAARLGSGTLAPPLRWLHRRVTRCIATSARAAAEAVDFGIPERRVARIPNGIDTSVFRPAEPSERQALRERLGFRASRVALYMGRLSEEKGPLLLVEAWSRIGWEPGEAELVVVGKGPQQAEVEARVADLGLLGSVAVRGAVDDPLPFYQAADLLVLPSRNEGLSNSVVEAVSAGLPLATTRVSGSEDIIDASQAGEMVEVGDAEGLAAAMRRILGDDQLRARQSEAARRYAVEHFSIDRVADATERLYFELVV